MGSAEGGGPTIFPINKRVYTPNDRTSRSGKRVAGPGRYRRWRELCSLLSWEISREEHLCARFFTSPRILRRRRAINHKSVTARGKLLESLFPAFSLFGQEASFKILFLLPPTPSFRLALSPSARKRCVPTPLLIVIVLMLRRTTAAHTDAAAAAAFSGLHPCRPRDNPEFRIIAAIRTIRRVSHSMILGVPFPPLRCSLLYFSPHESTLPSLVTAVHYVYSMHI